MAPDDDPAVEPPSASEPSHRAVALWSAAVLIVASAIVGYRGYQLSAHSSWKTPLITCAVGLLASAVGVLAKGSAHVVSGILRWHSRRGAQKAVAPVLEPAAIDPEKSPQHPAFPLEDYFGWLKTARVITVRDAVSFLLSDAAHTDRFISALREALKQGATAVIVLLCPCSPAMRARAQQLGMRYEKLKRMAEDALTELDQLWLGLSGDERTRLDVRLHQLPATDVEYRCDDRVLMAVLREGAPSQDGPHFEYSVDSAVGRLGVESLERIRTEPNVSTPLPAHMRGVLTLADDDGLLPIEEVEYVSYEDAVYLAFLDHREAALVNQRRKGVWKQGIKKSVACDLEPIAGPGNRDKRNCLDLHINRRYRRGEDREYTYFLAVGVRP